MLDPFSLTLAVLVAKALEGAADEMGRDALHGLGGLVTAVRRKIAGAERAERTLAAVERAPSDVAAIEAFAAALEEGMRARPALRAHFEELLAAAGQDRVTGPFVTQVLDEARVGKIVNIGHATTVTF